LIGTVVSFPRINRPDVTDPPSQYRNALDEWSGGLPSTVKLEGKLYKPVYDEILLAMDTVDGDTVDGPNLRERLAAWAGFGL
jgi:hypothetical protein